MRYRYYLYVLANKIITKQVEFRNVLKIKFTKSNIFPSIFVKSPKNSENNELLFTISLGTFRKLTKYLGWKKKNINYVVMLSLLIVNILKNSPYHNYILLVRNLKKSFFSMLLNLQYLNFKYLYVIDRTCFTKIKVKKKTHIKRRLYRKMTYLCPLKV